MGIYKWLLSILKGSIDYSDSFLLIILGKECFYLYQANKCLRTSKGTIIIIISRIISFSSSCGACLSVNTENGSNCERSSENNEADRINIMKILLNM